jgi:hypothetical protein
MEWMRSKANENELREGELEVKADEERNKRKESREKD